MGTVEDFAVGLTFTGFAVGKRVGPVVGRDFEGLAVGRRVVAVVGRGLAVGKRLVARDGMIDTLFDGAKDGRIEGIFVRTQVGTAVGLADSFVGAVDGRKLDRLVGVRQSPKLLSFLGTCSRRLTDVPKLLGMIFFILSFTASQRSALITMSGAVVNETFFFSSSSARAPATCGVAIDVPEYLT